MIRAGDVEGILGRSEPIQRIDRVDSTGGKLSAEEAALRLECVRLAKGDVIKAREIFAWVHSGASLGHKLASSQGSGGLLPRGNEIGASSSFDEPRSIRG